MTNPLKLQSSGNDFTIQPGPTPTSPPTMETGLGPDQPNEMTMERIKADAEANAKYQRVLDDQAGAQRDVDARHAARHNELDEREAELLRREARLRALEQPAEEAPAPPEPRPTATSRKRRA